MSELKYIAFEDEAATIKEEVTDYWTQRAESFLEKRKHELECKRAQQWHDQILNELKKVTSAQGKDLKILDIGCGTGYFEALLGKEGFDITGIDLTPEMIERANELIEEYGPFEGNVKALCMDAENLSFEDESFDAIITRNLTWTLPHPVEAYGEWFRVLKKGGVLVNFDAEYAKSAHSLGTHENCAHAGISDELNEKCHKIYHMLTISSLDRPTWDVEVLKEVGFKTVFTDRTFGDKLFLEKDEFYSPDHIFMITATK